MLIADPPDTPAISGGKLGGPRFTQGWCGAPSRYGI